jgi:hypothetical protein
VVLRPARQPAKLNQVGGRLGGSIALITEPIPPARVNTNDPDSSKKPRHGTVDVTHPSTITR